MDGVDATRGRSPRDGEVQVVETAGRQVVRPFGHADFEQGEELAAALDEALRAGGGRVVVDLGRLAFADSTFLHLLVRAAARGEVHLAGPLAPDVRRLFDITGLTPLFRFHADLDSALVP
ncbi:STAS domain-containing protein [Kitasatospora sp. NPDC059571]|uniref:STAS domain-containing protein n=1 Tax=Kitasatospora sp. NPDC059571 TaxID=3346871 RepID=UPI00367A185F